MMRPGAHFTRFALAFIASLCMACASSSSYDREVAKSLGRIYGKDFQGYQVRGTPVGTFGAGTMYLDEIDNGKLVDVDSAWLIGTPDSWWAPQVTEAERQMWLRKIIVPGALPTTYLSETISRKLGVEATLPKLYEMVSATIGTGWEKGVKVTLGASESTNRRIDWTEFMAAVNKNVIRDEIKDHLLRKDFRIIAADIVFLGYRATVDIDKKLQATVGAEFAKLATAGPLSGFNLKVTPSMTQRGSYVVESTSPVVVARLIKRPPAAQVMVLSSSNDILAWPTAQVDVALMNALDDALTRDHK